MLEKVFHISLFKICWHVFCGPAYSLSWRSSDVLFRKMFLLLLFIFWFSCETVPEKVYCTCATLGHRRGDGVSPNVTCPRHPRQGPLGGSGDDEAGFWGWGVLVIGWQWTQTVWGRQWKAASAQRPSRVPSPGSPPLSAFYLDLCHIFFRLSLVWASASCST